VDSSTVPQCANNPNYPNFFGTSAAAPHAAGLAALLLQANSSITPGDVYTAIRFTAAPMVNSSPDLTTGYGMIQAGAALAWPNMSVSPTTINLGQSAMLTWNAASINTCTATAGFSSTAVSGSMSVTPTAAGTSTYSMMCTNAAGNATENVLLTVNAAPGGGGGGHGGGGGLDELTLLALAGLGLLRALRGSSSAAGKNAFCRRKPK
jgi:hypothetical protein